MGDWFPTTTASTNHKIRTVQIAALEQTAQIGPSAMPQKEKCSHSVPLKVTHSRVSESFPHRKESDRFGEIAGANEFLEVGRADPRLVTALDLVEIETGSVDLGSVDNNALLRHQDRWHFCSLYFDNVPFLGPTTLFLLVMYFRTII
jgi:hypothetical protein